MFVPFLLSNAVHGSCYTQCYYTVTSTKLLKEQIPLIRVGTRENIEIVFLPIMCARRLLSYTRILSHLRNAAILNAIILLPQLSC